MLRMQHQNSVLRYSKGARGLSVPQRVSGVFTGTTISLSIWPRQRGNRYAFHAGRNLPDKEFRYLRTVIVNRPAPGRRQTLYVVLRLCRALCF